LLFADDARVRALNREFAGGRRDNVALLPGGRAGRARCSATSRWQRETVAPSRGRGEAIERTSPPSSRTASCTSSATTMFSTAEAERMEALERAVLGRLGYPDPYRDETLVSMPDGEQRSADHARMPRRG
jgi:hypothetical protein